MKIVIISQEAKRLNYVRSEFGPKEYSLNTLSNALRQGMICALLSSDRNDIRAKIVDAVNHAFADNGGSCVQMNNARSSWATLVENRTKRLKQFEWDYNTENNNGNEDPFAEYINAVCKVIVASQFYDGTIVDCYLNAFFSLCKNTVFNSFNYNLSSYQYRNSSYLYLLISLFSKEIFNETKTDENGQLKRSYEFSFKDPFAFDTIERAIICSRRLVNNAMDFPESNSEHIFALRRELLINSVESAFRRYIVLDRQTHLLDLNADGSRLYSDPVYLLSSVSNMRTIRLFEKTAAYIRKNIQFGKDSFKVKIVIIGHTNFLNNRGELEIADYAAEILQWYDALFEGGNKNKPVLTVEICNVFSEYELHNRGNCSKIDDFKLTKGDHSAIVNFVAVNYEEAFSYSPQKIIDYVNENNLVFLLDCPWLSTENTSKGDEGSLERYCVDIRQYSRKPEDAEKKFESDSKYFYRSSKMHELSDQFYQLMSSSSLTSGTVVRTLRDKYIQKIQKYVDDLRKNDLASTSKEVYVFSSENDGVNYSYIDSYPLTRIEQYDGKRFTIIQFLSTKSKMLPCGGKGAKFEINFWSVLKYLCIPFAQNYIVEKFFVNKGVSSTAGINDPSKETGIIYLELLRGIKVCFDVKSNMHNVTISLRATRTFRELLKKQACKDPNNTKNIILNEVFEFIKQLYSESVFPQSIQESQYGDDLIRRGFLMVVYSAARDVNTMLFYHLYQNACKYNDFSDFTVTYKSLDQGMYDNDGPSSAELSFSSDFIDDDEFAEGVFFADKKLYESLFATFEQDYRLYLGMIMMLRESQDIYDKGTNNSIAERLIDNVITVCENASMGNTRLCGNARIAKNNLSF